MLGTKQRDCITGFVGVVTGYVRYITGCDQALLTPPMKKDGVRPEPEWFDVQRLQQVDRSLVTLDNSRTPGPDMPAPKR